ncbi:hypothetical protein [Raoultibacter timonensis]|uniref:hypothetical protein n=1 Tax=Raoultibacter timonensis TaxID=1907662 RepID=UPI0026DCEA31|nr:hypothetical protein [Raoultibacter timonensis]
MKKSGLFVSAGMVACLAIGLVGCGGSDAPSEETASAPAEAVSESPEASVDESVEIKPLELEQSEKTSTPFSNVSTATDKEQMVSQRFTITNPNSNAYAVLESGLVIDPSALVIHQTIVIKPNETIQVVAHTPQKTDTEISFAVSANTPLEGAVFMSEAEIPETWAQFFGQKLDAPNVTAVLTEQSNMEPEHLRLSVEMPEFTTKGDIGYYVTFAAMDGEGGFLGGDTAKGFATTESDYIPPAYATGKYEVSFVPYVRD